MTKGTHGYDNENAEMRAVFFAQGPAFKKASDLRSANASYRIPAFQNLQIYDLITDILHIEGAPNNGTESDHEMLHTFMNLDE
jgi:ectonucleotide pyrophosphatase/phosphodiesterase family protein 1/3